MGKKGKLSFPLLLAAVLLGSALVFWLCWRFDNKYTRPRPAADLGVVRLNMDWYDRNPFFFLVDGWSLYRDVLLTPEELPEHLPDAYLYLGQYGGFDLGDPGAAPRGEATYRTVILTDGRERTYALELTEIYSHWRLWVNGRLVESVGMGDEDAPAPGKRMVTFTASGQIEIVAAVRDDRGFYSGMVYPPAFGSPERVDRMAAARLLIHDVAGVTAALVGLLCVLAALSRRFSTPYAALALLCLCFCAETSWPAFHALGISGEIWPLLARLGYYGVFPALIWAQGRTCGLPPRFYRAACGAGGLVCLGVLLGALFPASSTWALLAWSGFLSVYKWLAFLWLFCAGVWALRAGRRYSKAFLAGCAVFAAALLMDRLLPLHEPVLLGWFPEMAGGLLAPLVAVILCHDSLRAYRESRDLLERQRLAEFQLAAQAEQSRLAQEYVRSTRERLHETRSRLTLIRHYLDAGELGKLSAYLDEITAAPGAGPREYTGHGLTDAILSVQLSRAAQLGVYVEQELEPLPPELPVEDGDLTSLLLNLLENALEGCMRLPDPAERWIWLGISLREEELVIACRNAAPLPQDGEASTSKPDKGAHGFGLPRLREIAGRYGGEFSIHREDNNFSAQISLKIRWEAPVA